MAHHRAAVEWALKDGEDFAAGRYGRGHQISFEGGHTAPGTASAQVVGNKWAAAGAIDPEELLTASISACHMLTFLHKAREAGFVVIRYRDDAEGLMEKIDGDRMAVTRVTLKPQISYAGRPPNAEERDQLHHAAHEQCFIANSVKTQVVVEERDPAA
ncbi:MAG: putative redox protein regulator of disulfide bond formation [Phenylobacterium sp.]|nr:putative redox protein regulator of disulfide bond formation [Phenylobacterium sp.]MDB5493415.1 putative redox protein regulator of disulfide bond formation [Phenylobacterium sp.]